MQKIVVLTGAGISAESGIPTFRATDGLWEHHRVEDVATPEAFARNPKLVQDFYNKRRQTLQSVKPNLAHEALAEFERQHRIKPQNSFLLVTQNIDDLHERAGSKNLIHMHGELLKMRCQKCSKVADILQDLHVDDACPNCDAVSHLRPHIVWFGEMPLQMNVIDNALMQANLFVSIGTSGNVYPASGFVQRAKSSHAHCVELNLEPSQGDHFFDTTLYGKASQIVPQFFSNIGNYL